MNMRKSTIAVLGMILFSFVIGIYFYPKMPEKMASHWNVQGRVDGYMSKFWGLFLMPFVLVGLALLFTAIPRIDPLKANIEKFRKYYDGFIILFFIFMLSIHFQVILWNLGIRISPNVIAPIGIGILFFYIGILCENAKRNWFIGIRTPWTLSSERVWEKTHKIGGKLFKIAGVIAFFWSIFPELCVIFHSCSCNFGCSLYDYLFLLRIPKGGNMMACSGTFSLRSNPSGRITADKRGIRDFPKLPSATSFIRRTLGAMHFERNKNMERENA